jgi:hypothetical protein
MTVLAKARGNSTDRLADRHRNTSHPTVILIVIPIVHSKASTQFLTLYLLHFLKFYPTSYVLLVGRAGTAWELVKQLFLYQTVESHRIMRRRGDEVVSLNAPTPLYPQEDSWHTYLLEAGRP